MEHGNITVLEALRSGSQGIEVVEATPDVVQNKVYRVGSTLYWNGSPIGGSYVLPTASGSVLGGVRVGSGLTIDGSGVLSAVVPANMVTTDTAQTVTGVKTFSYVESVNGHLGVVTQMHSDGNVDNFAQATQAILYVTGSLARGRTNIASVAYNAAATVSSNDGGKRFCGYEAVHLALGQNTAVNVPTYGYVSSVGYVATPQLILQQPHSDFAAVDYTVPGSYTMTERRGLYIATPMAAPTVAYYGIKIEDAPASPTRYSIYTGNAPSRFGGGIELPSFAPSSTANKLYNNGGTLYWNGSVVGGGTLSGSGTSGQLARWNGTSSITSDAGLIATVTGAVTTGLQVGDGSAAIEAGLYVNAAAGQQSIIRFREGGSTKAAIRRTAAQGIAIEAAGIDYPLVIAEASGGTIELGGSTLRPISMTGALTVAGIATVNNRSVFTTTMSVHGSVNTILVTANHDQSSGAAWALTAATRFKSGAGANSDAKGHTSFTTFQDSVSVASSGLNKARGFYAVAGQNDASNSSCGTYYGYSTLTGSGGGVTNFGDYVSFAVDDENYVNATFVNRYGLFIKTGNVSPSAGWYGVYIQDAPAGTPSAYSIRTGTAPSRFGGSIELPSFVPSVTTTRLYNNAGTLYWNGVAVATGNSLTGTGTANRVMLWSGATTATSDAGLSVYKVGGISAELTIGDGSTTLSPYFAVDSAALGTGGYAFRLVGVNRWVMSREDTTNVYQLRAFNSAGVEIDKVLAFANAAAGLMTFGGSTARSALFTGAVSVTQGLELLSYTPGTTTNRLYNVSGTLYWNGSAVGSGGAPANMVTTNTVQTITATKTFSRVNASYLSHYNASDLSAALDTIWEHQNGRFYTRYTATAVGHNFEMGAYNSAGTVITPGLTIVTDGSVPTVVNFAVPLTIAVGTPSSTTNALYNVGGALYWNGSAVGGSYSLPTASDTVLGGIKVGAGLSINAGVLSVGPSASLDYIDFNTSLTQPSYVTGRIYWNNVDNTLDAMLTGGSILQVGQETLVRAVNNTGATIANGSIVYISGAQGNRPTIALANASVDAKSKVVGVATQDVANNAVGYFTVHGTVHDIDTSAFAEGAEVWLGIVDGSFVAARPAAPNAAVCIGYVVRSHATVGQLFVSVNRGFKLADLGNVSTSSLADGQVLTYNGGVWSNATPTVPKIVIASVTPAANTSMTSAWISRHTRVAPSASINVVVEPGIASAGDEISLLQENTTFFVLTAGSGVTLRCATSQTTIQPRAMYSNLRLICVAANTYDVIGDFVP